MFRLFLIKIAVAASVAAFKAGLAARSSSGSSTAGGSTAAATRFRRADRLDDGRRHRQADRPVLPARPELRLLKAVRRQDGPGHQAERGTGALQNHWIAYAMTTHHGAVENQGIGTSVSNLAFTAGS
jgi:hypothetical protein